MSRRPAATSWVCATNTSIHKSENQAVEDDPGRKSRVRSRIFRDHPAQIEAGREADEDEGDQEKRHPGVETALARLDVDGRRSNVAMTLPPKEMADWKIEPSAKPPGAPSWALTEFVLLDASRLGSRAVATRRGNEMRKLRMLALSLAIAGSIVPSGVYAQSAGIAAAVANVDARTPDNVKLDEGRKPAEVLSFFRLEPGMQVIDMFGAQQILGGDHGAGGRARRASVIVWQPAQFINDKRRADFAAFAAKQPNVVLISSPFEEPLIGTNRYDFMIMNLDYHDVYWESTERKIPRMEPQAWLKRLYAAMKPGAMVGIIDHVGRCPAATRARWSRSCTASIPAMVKADFEKAGFVLEGSSDLLRNPADDHTLLVFDEKIRGKTDRVHVSLPEAAMTQGRRGRRRHERSRRRRLSGPDRARRRLAGRRGRAVARRRPARAGAAGRELRRRPVAQRAQDDRHPAGRRAAGHRHRQGRGGGAGRADRGPVGPVDRHRLHRLGDLRRADDRAAHRAVPASAGAGAGDAGRPGRARSVGGDRRRCRASPISSKASFPTMSSRPPPNGEVLPLVVFAMLFALAIDAHRAASGGARSSVCSRRSPTPCW